MTITNAPFAINADSLGSAYYSLLRRLVATGATVSPRGKVTRELIGTTILLSNPRTRVLRIPERRWSLPLALGEFCWHVSGEDRAKSLTYYAPRWADFLDDPDKVRGGCYGKRIFGNKSKGSQWDRCLAMLRADPSTRRAVLLLHDPDSVLDALSHDVSCAVSMQLLVRDEMLHAFVSMRSNDAILGLPYDAFLFTMLQELAAATLGYRLGTYVHHAVSMHLYEEDLRLAERILAHEQTDASAEMEPLKGPEYCFTFIEVERELRCHGHSARAGTLPPYWRTLAGVLAEFATGRRCHESRALADAS